LEEIRVNLDKRAVKRKEDNQGLLVQVHPIKRRKNARCIRLGRYLEVAEARS